MPGTSPSEGQRRRREEAPPKRLPSSRCHKVPACKRSEVSGTASTITPGSASKRSSFLTLPASLGSPGSKLSFRERYVGQSLYPHIWDSDAAPRDFRAEDLWKAENLQANIRSGCLTLALYSIITVARQFLMDAQHRMILEDAQITQRSWLVAFFLSVSSVWLVYCYVNPSRLKHYLGLLSLWYAFITLQGVPPFFPMCDDYINSHVKEPAMEKNPNAYKGVEHMDCTLQGHSFMVLLMIWILTSYRFIPRYDMMRLNWLYIFGIFTPATILWRQKENVYKVSDVYFSIGILCICQFIATTRKWSMRTYEKSTWIYNRKQRNATRKLFGILQIMVPLHAIKPMIIGPQDLFAEHIDRVSILFIMLDDYDVEARQRSTAELLRFLNSNFEAWDRICAEHKVTQIETAIDHYVCAVGVVPADIEGGKTEGHSSQLARLVRVALEIFNRSKTVKLKMGLNTGPVVAGVIGKKLPRFRLFGDTMNTAAHFMRNGEPQQLQCGETSYDLLPDRLWRTPCQRRKIDFGKGFVTAYLLDLKGSVQDLSDGTTTSDQPPSESLGLVPRRSRSLQTRSLLDRLAPTLSGSMGASTGSEKFMAAAWSASMRGTVGAPAGLAGGAVERQRAGRRPRFMSVDEVIEIGEDEDSSEEDADDDELEEVIKVLHEQHARDFEASVRTDSKAKEEVEHVTWTNSILTCGLRRKYFTKAVEEEWFQWQHSDLMCRGIVLRLNIHTVGIAVITAYDCLNFVHHFRKSGLFNQQPFYGERPLLRLPVFLFLRLMAFLIVSFWEELASTGSESKLRSAGASRSGSISTRAVSHGSWFATHPRLAQRWLLVSYCGLALIIFVSYCSISRGPVSVPFCTPPPSMTEKFCREALKEHAENFTRISSVNYFFAFLVWFLISTEHPFLFTHCFGFIFLGVTLVIWGRCMSGKPKGLGGDQFWLDMIAGDIRGHPIDFTNAGGVKALLLVILNLLVAYHYEKDSRTRFKARKTYDEMQVRADDILKKLMPPMVVQEQFELPPGVPLNPHRYQEASIAQSKLFGFTALASTRSPTEIVRFMSDLFGRFDALSDVRGIWKVETVGNTYIAGQAEPPLTLRRSPASVVLFGYDMVRAAEDWAKEFDLDVQCRVAVHSGECIGGVVGSINQRYHLFGDLISVLTVLVETGEDSRVHVTKACKDAVHWERHDRNLRRFEGHRVEVHEEGAVRIEGYERRDVAGCFDKVQHYAALDEPTYFVNFCEPEL